MPSEFDNEPVVASSRSPAKREQVQEPTCRRQWRGAAGCDAMEMCCSTRLQRGHRLRRRGEIVEEFDFMQDRSQKDTFRRGWTNKDWISESC